MNPDQAPSPQINPLAGKPAPTDILVNIPQLITDYYSKTPDPSVKEQRVLFGTSGHRGSATEQTFNEWHILAVTQAIVLYRQQQNINGPLFIGFDTHALSAPAFASALEVLAANAVQVMISKDGEYTPTPAISHAILCYNRGREQGLADGIVITPSHNPPNDGGFKYNPPNGGPADQNVTRWIEDKANEFLKAKLQGVRRIPLEKALATSTTQPYDYLHSYVEDLAAILDMQLISDSNLHIGVNPLGGASVHYWNRIAERYHLNLSVANTDVDPTFRFMTVDWDGQIRMDPSSAYAMAGLIRLKDQFAISFACDTDSDRHGIITPSSGLMPPNHFLAVAVCYLFQHRPEWSQTAAVGKTVVSSQMIDRVTAKLGRKLYETPVGFKWFVDGLLDGSLGFGGEESAGASFLRRNGQVWTTDKDGMVPALLSAEITARLGRDPGEIYKEMETALGVSHYQRVDKPATAAAREILKNLSAAQISQKELAGEPIKNITNTAPGNNAPIGGIKISADNGWFAVRPSGTEDIYKIYAESWQSAEHLERILQEAQLMVKGFTAT